MILNFVLLIFFLMMSVFFSASETAIISANKMRLRSLSVHGDKRAETIVHFLERPEQLLSVILIGNNLVNIAAVTVASIIVRQSLYFILEVTNIELESLVTTLVMTPVILVLGEIIPKSVGREKADSLSLKVSKLIRLMSIVLYPIVIPVNKIVSIFSKTYIQDPNRIEEEIRYLARLGRDEGIINPEQSEMVHSVLDLKQKTVEKVKVPLIDVISFEKDTTVEDFYAQAVKTPYSRFPVYDKKNDNIIGIVELMDVVWSKSWKGTISQFIHEDIVYLPESKHIYTSLRELQASPHPMGIVVDEYGGATGIVTLEDIASEVVGDLSSSPNVDKMVERSTDGKTIECSGRTEISLINDLLGTNIPDDQFKTIGGFVMSQMDKIPVEGEELQWQDLNIKVIKASKRSILRLRISSMEREKDEEAKAGNTQG